MKILFLLFSLFYISNLFAAPRLTPYLVYLKPGTVLENISSEKKSVLTKGLYAKVLETDQGRRDRFIVYNKYGIAAYYTNAYGIVEIADDVRLLPNVDAEVIYPPPSTLKADNKHAFFDTQFNLHLDSLQTASLNAIYNQDLPNAIGNRYEIRTLYVSAFPVNFGLGLNYQTAYWANDFDTEVRLSILSLGPQIQYYLYEGDAVSLSVLGGVEYAPVYKTTAGDLVEKYTATLFDVGTELAWDTSYGIWNIGVHYRKHDLTLSSTTRSTPNIVPEDITISSIGGMIGYKYEWDL